MTQLTIHDPHNPHSLPVSAYDTDYQQWLDQTVAQLRAKDFDNLDLANLIEEIESLGKHDKRAISSYLMRFVNICSNSSIRSLSEQHALEVGMWKSRTFAYKFKLFSTIALAYEPTSAIILYLNTKMQESFS